MTELTVKATNQGTYIITGDFKDADDSAVSPITLTWSLLDEDGNVINSRDSVSVTPDTSVSVVLGPADLDRSVSAYRAFIFEGTYNSITYGNGLTIRGQAVFGIGDWIVKV